MWKSFRFDEAEPELQAELKLDTCAIPMLEDFVRGRSKRYSDFGRALLKTTNRTRAIWALQKAAALAPHEANLHYLLAQAYRVWGARTTRRENLIQR